MSTKQTRVLGAQNPECCDRRLSSLPRECASTQCFQVSVGQPALLTLLCLL